MHAPWIRMLLELVHTRPFLASQAIAALPTRAILGLANANLPRFSATTAICALLTVAMPQVDASTRR